MLTQSVDSALMQDYDNKEILIGDDGSNEATRAVCEKYEQEHGIISRIVKMKIGLK